MIDFCYTIYLINASSYTIYVLGIVETNEQQSGTYK